MALADEREQTVMSGERCDSGELQRNGSYHQLAVTAVVREKQW
jgi:hypothetical protein